MEQPKYHLSILENTTTDQWYPRETRYLTDEQYRRVSDFIAHLDSAFKPVIIEIQTDDHHARVYGISTQKELDDTFGGRDADQ